MCTLDLALNGKKKKEKLTNFAAAIHFIQLFFYSQYLNLFQLNDATQLISTEWLTNLLFDSQKTILCYHWSCKPAWK